MKWWLVALFLFLPLVTAAISSYVQDNAGVFSATERSSLDNELREFQTQTKGVQIVVFTENKIPDGTTLEERSLQIAEENRIGQKEEDNGLLFYLAVEDRQFRWEVGYGLEPVLNAALLGRISRQEMVPLFQEGKYAEGIRKGVTVVEGIILGEVDAEAYQEPRMESPFGTLLIFLVIFIIILVFANLSKKSRKRGSFEDGAYIGAASGLFFGRMGRGGFGGSFGGFSGGGGSFGGGGFSGRF